MQVKSYNLLSFSSTLSIFTRLHADQSRLFFERERGLFSTLARIFSALLMNGRDRDVRVLGLVNSGTMSPLKSQHKFWPRLPLIWILLRFFLFKDS